MQLYEELQRRKAMFYLSGETTMALSIMQMGQMVLSFVITLIIPGHILNFKAKKQQ